MITDTSTNPESAYFLTYSFTSEEVALLAKFLREKQSEIPLGLENFHSSLERAIYSNLTIEEAKRFYS